MVEINDGETTSGQAATPEPATPTSTVVPDKPLSPDTPSTDGSTLTPDQASPSSQSSSNNPEVSSETNFTNGHRPSDSERSSSEKNDETTPVQSIPEEIESDAEDQETNCTMIPSETPETPEKTEPSEPESSEKPWIADESQSTTEASAEISSATRTGTPKAAIAPEENVEQNADNQTPQKPEIENVSAADGNTLEESSSPQEDPEVETQPEAQQKLQTELENAPLTIPDVETDIEKLSPDAEVSEETFDQSKTPDLEECAVSSDAEKAEDDVLELESPSQRKEQVPIEDVSGAENEGTSKGQSKPPPSEPENEETTEDVEETQAPEEAPKLESSPPEDQTKAESAVENEGPCVDSNPASASSADTEEKPVAKNSHLDVWMGDVDSQKTKESIADEKPGAEDESDGNKENIRGNDLSVIKEKEERSEQEEIGGDPEGGADTDDKNGKEATEHEHQGNGIFETSLRTEKKRKGAKANFEMSQCCSIL